LNRKLRTDGPRRAFYSLQRPAKLTGVFNEFRGGIENSAEFGIETNKNIFFCFRFSFDFEYLLFFIFITHKKGENMAEIHYWSTECIASFIGQ
jgi:hypothetical protein